MDVEMRNMIRNGELASGQFVNGGTPERQLFRAVLEQLLDDLGREHVRLTPEIASIHPEQFPGVESPNLKKNRVRNLTALQRHAYDYLTRADKEREGEKLFNDHYELFYSENAGLYLANCYPLVKEYCDFAEVPVAGFYNAAIKKINLLLLNCNSYDRTHLSILRDRVISAMPGGRIH